MAGRFQNPNYQFFDENGDPLAGGKLEFFVSGTSTPQDTYSDDALTVANTNPVILDGAGRAGDIFLLSTDYKVVLKESDDTVVWTADPVRSTTPKSSDVKNVSTTTQLDTSDDGKWIAADATAGGFVITLPAVADVGNGYEVTVQKVDSSANVVTVDGSGSETINGVSDVALEQQYEAITLRSDGTRWLSPLNETGTYPPNHINGLDLSNGAAPTTDVNIAAGTARSDDDSANMVRSQTITKKLNAAFAEGNNQGGLDTGTVAADTAYDVYLISKNDGTTDGLFTKRGDNPALPSGFSNKRLIGRIATDGSSNIESNEFSQERIDGQKYRAWRDTTSGDTFNFIALPDNVERIEISMDQVSLSGIDAFSVQLGTGQVATTTGYTWTSGGTTSTTGFDLNVNNAARQPSGHWTLTLLDADNNTWVCTATSGTVPSLAEVQGQGRVAISGAIDILVFKSSGSNTFDNGTVGITAVQRI